MVYKEILIEVFLHKFHTSGKSGSWDMGQNALGQLDCRICKSTISREQNDEKPDFWHVDVDSWKLKVDWKILG